MIKRKLWVFLGVGLVLALTAGVLGADFAGVGTSEKSAAISGVEADSDCMVIKFADDLLREEADLIAEQFGFQVMYSKHGGGIARIKLDVLEQNPELFELIEDESVVEIAEPEYSCWASYVPNDPLYGDQWNFQSFAEGGIDVQAAWDDVVGDPNIIVAIVDSGVAFEEYTYNATGYDPVYYHLAPDLAGTNFVSPRRYYIRTAGLKEFVEYDDHPYDDAGHGTHVAGTVAQTTDNAEGVAGAAFGCSIMPVKVLYYDQGSGQAGGSALAVAAGIKYAADSGAKVINLSFTTTSDSDLIRDAVEYAYNAGCVIVAAAGNTGGSYNYIEYPAAYDDYCIAVAATDSSKNRAYFSNYHAYVDVAAPGVSIKQQTYIYNGMPTSFSYRTMSGTSMAAPHVSAVAALVASDGITDRDLIRQAIEGAAYDLGDPGKDIYFGWGLVNARAAVDYFAISDFDMDGDVDEDDLAVFSSQWLETGVDLEADLYADEHVDLADFSIFAKDWLHNVP